MLGASSFPQKNFWRYSLGVQIRTQWIHVHSLGQKYYLNYVTLKLCPNMHIVGLCLPMDFKPVFVAGAPAWAPGTGQHRAAPWSGTWSRGRGSRAPLCFRRRAVAETLQCWQVASLCFSWTALLEWQDLFRKTFVAKNLWSQNTHSMKIHIDLAKGKT